MKSDVYSSSWKKLEKKIDLDDSVWGCAVNEPLIAQAVRVYMLNQRQCTATSKSRGEVSGGGRKPWSQKGTGRARQGSIRSPIWVGGGVAHGPQGHVVRVKMSKKMAKRALSSALTQKNQNGNVYIINKLPAIGKSKVKEKGVKFIEDFKKNLTDGFLMGGKLAVIADSWDKLDRKMFSGMDNVVLYTSRILSTRDVVFAKYLVFTEDALKVLESRLAKDAGSKGGTANSKIQKESKVETVKRARSSKSTGGVGKSSTKKSKKKVK